jgi:hypothetical protein
LRRHDAGLSPQVLRVESSASLSGWTVKVHPYMGNMGTIDNSHADCIVSLDTAERAATLVLAALSGVGRTQARSVED